MKWLILQTDGIHKGQDEFTRNDFMRECHFLKHALEQNGQQVDLWGKRHDNYNGEPPDWLKYDVALWLEQYEFEGIPRPEDVTAGPMKLQYIIDLHCNDAESYLPYSRGCDLVLHATKSIMRGYEARGAGAEHKWWPLGVDDRYFKPQNKERHRDVIFAGSRNPVRVSWVEYLEREVGLKQFYQTGLDYVALVSTAKVHFNKNIGTDFNGRTFETIGLGTCLVTNQDPIMKELGFEDDKNCLTYTTKGQAKAAIEYALEGEWKRIGESAAEFARQHTYTERVRALLKYLNDGPWEYE